MPRAKMPKGLTRRAGRAQPTRRYTGPHPVRSDGSIHRPAYKKGKVPSQGGTGMLPPIMPPWAGVGEQLDVTCKDMLIAIRLRTTPCLSATQLQRDHRHVQATGLRLQLGASPRETERLRHRGTQVAV